MRLFTFAAVVLALAVLAGCGALGAPTAEAPAWVQVMDRLTHVEAKVVTPAPTPENPKPVPVTVVTQAPPTDPTNGAIPGAATALAVLAVLWYKLRSSAAASLNTANLLANTVPKDAHLAALEAASKEPHPNEGT